MLFAAMATTLSVLMPVALAGLYGAIYRKAGFSGAVMSVCLLPLLSEFWPLLTIVGRDVGSVILSNPWLAPSVSVVLMVLNLVPPLVLAAAPWPVRGADHGRV